MSTIKDIRAMSTSFGAGRLDANAAVNATVTANPISISFGALSGSLPAATPVTITNGGSSSVSLTIAAGAPQALAGTAVTGISVNVDQKSLTVAAGATATFNVSLSGAIPTAGQYSGNITVQGTGVSLHIPYLFIVSSNVVYDMFGISQWVNLQSVRLCLFHWPSGHGPWPGSTPPDQARRCEWRAHRRVPGQVCDLASQ